MKERGGGGGSKMELVACLIECSRPPTQPPGSLNDACLRKKGFFRMGINGSASRMKRNLGSLENC